MVKIVIVGDIFLGAGGAEYPFAEVGVLLDQGDIVFGNLEVCLSHQGIPAQKRVLLKSDPSDVNYLVKAGFDIVNLANNHVLDFGKKGLLDTLNVLETNNIQVIGAGRDESLALEPVILDEHNLSIGFLGFTQVLSDINFDPQLPACAYFSALDDIVDDVKTLAQHVDFPVISLHWGMEYVPYPNPDQQAVARALIDAGAKLILGHHPHVVQGVESYKGGLIFYSLGNFQFAVEQDLMFAGTDYGLAGIITVNSEGISDYELIPVDINSVDHCPRLLSTDKASEQLEHIERLSSPLYPAIDANWWYRKACFTYISSQLDSYKVRFVRYGFFSQAYGFFRWLVSRFTIRMFVGCIDRTVRSIFGKEVLN